LKGRLAVTGGGAGSTWNGSLFSYDAMGRVTTLWQCGPATCGTLGQLGFHLAHRHAVAVQSFRHTSKSNISFPTSAPQWAAALDHLHACASVAKPARTGFSSV
jgi:hypothetical protein